MKRRNVAVFEVEREDPRTATSPIFSNFVGISHAGSEVQFEFIFLDINTVAKIFEQKECVRQEEGSSLDEKPLVVSGKTVAKVVMPVASFVQLRKHLEAMFARLDKVSESNADEQEDFDERARSGS